MSDIKDRIRRVLRDNFNILELKDDDIFYSKDGEPDVLSDTDSALDSLDHVEFVMCIEDEFDQVIDDAVAPSLITVNAVAVHIESLRAQQ